MVDEVFRNNYDFGGSEPDFGGDPEEPYIGYRQNGESLQETVEGLTQPVDERIAQILAEQLIEDEYYRPQDGEGAFYSDEMRYERVSHADIGHAALWDDFCEVVIYRERFFNDRAKEKLAEIFKNIHLQRDASRNYPVYLMDPSSEENVLFRARLTDDSGIRAIAADPEGQMGPPPRRLGKPNRMNPSGVPAMYAAFDAETCISELRPLVGAKVAVASFKLLRPICVLDMTRFQAPPKELNLFAKDHIRRLSQWRFMQSFMTEIAKPISPADEHIDYVPTQVVADYLNNQHTLYMGKNQQRIEAIIYNSAQRPGGRNIVLLNDACLVSTPAKRPHRPEAALQHFLDFKDYQRLNSRKPCLALVEKSLKFVQVDAASFTTRMVSSFAESNTPHGFPLQF